MKTESYIKRVINYALRWKRLKETSKVVPIDYWKARKLINQVYDSEKELLEAIDQFEKHEFGEIRKLPFSTRLKIAIDLLIG